MLFYFIIPAGFILVYYGNLSVINDELTKAFCTAFVRKLFGILIICLILGCESFDKSVFVNYFHSSLMTSSFTHSYFDTFLDIILRILNSRVTILLGKLTFCSYLIHINIIYVLMGDVHKPVYISTTEIVNTIFFKRLLL